MAEKSIYNKGPFLVFSNDNPSPHSLKSGGGGGTSDGMEARVAKLEASVEHIQKDIAEIKGDVREFRSGIGALLQPAL
jgi:hypothetical protein